MRRFYGQIRDILGRGGEVQEYQQYLCNVQGADFRTYETAKLYIDFLDKALESFWKEATPDAL